MGAWLANYLQGAGLAVMGVVSDNEITTDELFWYRKHQLENSGVKVHFMNYSNESQMDSLLHTPVHNVIYLLPPGEVAMTITAASRELRGFTLLLEKLRSVSRCTRVLLVCPSASSHYGQHSSIEESLVSMFEVTLGVYHYLYKIPITVLRMGGVYGPWSQLALDLATGQAVHAEACRFCWYTPSVVRAVHRALQLGGACQEYDLGPCQHVCGSDSAPPAYFRSWKALNVSFRRESFEEGVERMLVWARAYLQWRDNSNAHVVFTSYFTSSRDPQWNVTLAPNRFQYMAEWLYSLRELGMEAVVFHDQLEHSFTSRLQELHPGLSFHQVRSLGNRSTNDARFYSYLHYLEAHPLISRVLLTDISDVWFQKNPFDLMDLFGEGLLYIGQDIDIFPSMELMPWLSTRLQGCFGEDGSARPLMGLDAVFNAGLIGGSRGTLLAFLSRLTRSLDATPPQLNCNMPAVNYVAHKYFSHLTFTGFPLNSRFLCKQSSPKGVYVVHK